MFHIIGDIQNFSVIAHHKALKGKERLQPGRSSLAMNMPDFSGSKLYTTAISAVFGLLLSATTAQATPILGDIINAWGSVEFTGLNLDLNETDSFSSGTLDYVLNGATAGQFVFTNHNFTSVFNTSCFVDNTFSFTLWGGDSANDLGIDLAFIGSFLSPVVSSSAAPLPATGLLMLMGFAGIFLSRRLEVLH